MNPEDLQYYNQLVHDYNEAHKVAVKPAVVPLPDSPVLNVARERIEKEIERTEKVLEKVGDENQRTTIILYLSGLRKALSLLTS